jgi:hypothetical protein
MVILGGMNAAPTPIVGVAFIRPMPKAIKTVVEMEDAASNVPTPAPCRGRIHPTHAEGNQS